EQASATSSRRARSSSRFRGGEQLPHVLAASCSADARQPFTTTGRRRTVPPFVVRTSVARLPLRTGATPLTVTRRPAAFLTATFQLLLAWEMRARATRAALAALWVLTPLT